LQRVPLRHYAALLAKYLGLQKFRVMLLAGHVHIDRGGLNLLSPRILRYFMMLLNQGFLSTAKSSDDSSR